MKIMDFFNKTWQKILELRKNCIFANKKDVSETKNDVLQKIWLILQLWKKNLNGFMICSFMPQSLTRKIKFYANLTLNVGFHNKWTSFCHKLKFSKAECRKHSLKYQRFQRYLESFRLRLRSFQKFSSFSETSMQNLIFVCVLVLVGSTLSSADLDQG